MAGGVVVVSPMLIVEILVSCLLLLDSWLFVTIRAEEKWVPLLFPYLLGHHCCDWTITLIFQKGFSWATPDKWNGR
jgi:hypothetical protein